METQEFAGVVYRLFQGHETRQLDGVSTHKAQPQHWYFEPSTYEGDVLYSYGYATYDHALAEMADDARLAEEAD